MNVFTIAEIGINHNGSLEIAKKLIDLANFSGFDGVKFQKRTNELVYTPEKLAAPRKSPWGATYGQYRAAIEFGQEEFEEIDRHCRSQGISWSASAWDPVSLTFLEQFDLGWHKLASALIGNTELLRRTADYGRPTYISTGMCRLEDIDRAVAIFERAGCRYTLMHCNSAYPAAAKDLNLRTIGTLRERYDCPVGYSGHENSLAPTLAAVALGATAIERHITLDKTMYGSDQAASVNPVGCIKLIEYVRELEVALGDGVKRITPEEEQTRERLGVRTACALSAT